MPERGDGVSMHQKPNMDPEQLRSYRSTSNLSYISKIVEWVVAKCFTAHVNASHLLLVHQSAYRAHHSTETAILSVYNALVHSIDDGKVSVLVLLDLSAAFDTADHNILLSLLSRRFCIRDTAHAWFRSYLSCCTQSLSFAGQQTISTRLQCTSRVSFRSTQIYCLHREWSGHNH